MNLFLTFINYLFYIAFSILFILTIYNSRKIDYKFAIVIIIFLAIFRYGIGTDYRSYEIFYEIFAQERNFSNFNYEFGFLAYSYLVSIFTKNPVIFISLTAFIQLLFLNFWIRDNSTNKVMSIFIYLSFFFLVWTLSGIRQGLVLTIGSYFLFNQKFHWNGFQLTLIFILLLLLHQSAFVYIPIYFISNINWSKKGLIILTILSLMFSFVSMSRILQYLYQFQFFSDFFDYSRFLYYLKHTVSYIGFWDIYSLMRLFFILILLIFYDAFKDEKFYFSVYKSAVIGLNLYFYLKFSDLIAARMTIYFLFLIVILFPIIYDYVKLRYPKRTQILFMLMFLSLNTFMYLKDLYAMNIQMNNLDNVYFTKYQSIFDECFK